MNARKAISVFFLKKKKEKKRGNLEGLKQQNLYKEYLMKNKKVKKFVNERMI